MKYKTKKYHIFREKLNIPDNVYENIYSNSLSIEDYYKYDLEDKVPIEVLDVRSRNIINKFGIEESRKFDTYFIFKNGVMFDSDETFIKEVNTIEELNEKYYSYMISINRGEFLKYSDNFIEKHPEVYVGDLSISNLLKQKFYRGNLSIIDIIDNWENLKNKRIDQSIENVISKDLLVDFIENYKDIKVFFEKELTNKSFVEFINELYTKIERDEQLEFIKNFLRNKMKNRNDLNSEEYKVIFNYLEIDDYLNVADYVKEKFKLNLKDSGYENITDIPIPVEVLLNSSVIFCLNHFGIKNIIDFDKENNYFFSNNNYEMLINMYDMFIKYAANNRDNNTNIFVKEMNQNKENNFEERFYTKEEFYESMRRMFINVPFDHSELMINVDNIYGEFREKNSDLFFMTDVPIEIKQRYYSKELMPNDFLDKDIVKYFTNVDISYGLGGEYSYVKNIFDNETLIEIFKITSDIFSSNDYEFFSNINNKVNKKISLEEAKELIYESFCNLPVKKCNFVVFLKRLGIENEFINEKVEQINILMKSRPELDYNNPALCIELLNKEIFDSIGINTICEVLEFNSGAHLEIINNYKDPLFVNWIKYVKNLSIYDIKVLHHSILSFNNMKPLIEELINNGLLSNDQINNLLEVISQRNCYNVNNISELNNYQEHRKNILNDRLQSNEINTIKSSLLESLYNVNLSETEKIISHYKLDSFNYVKEVLLKNNVINELEYGVIVSIVSILNINDINELKDKMNELISIGSINCSLFQIERKLKKYYGKLFKDSLFDLESSKDRKDIKFSEVNGTDFDMLDINGNEMKNRNIQVIEFDGIPFKMFLHKLHNYDPKFGSFASRIIENPSLWNELEGASTLSTSMISDTHMKRVNGEDAVYYGFTEISSDALMLMGRRDIFVEHGGRKLEPTSNINEYMSPNYLQMVSNTYNEVALDRKQSGSDKFGGRIQPTYIVCFNGEINDKSKKAAEYFNIPIIMIDEQKYELINNNYFNKYKSLEIDKLDIEDIERLMYFKSVDLEEKYNIALNLCDYALSNNYIKEIDYIKFLERIEYIINDISMYEKIDKIDLTKVEERLHNFETKEDIYGK